MSHEVFFPVPPTITNITATRCIDYSSGLEGVFDINVNAPHRSLSLAKVSGQDVAYCIYSLEKKRIKIERLTVRPTFRRQGIATDIVNAIAERYTPCTMQMTIDASNIEANEWARAVGFGATKFIRGCESSGDEVQLEFMEIGNIEK